MMIARVVTNNRPDEPYPAGTDGTPIMSVQSMGLDHFTGEIVLRATDMALDPVELRAPFGCTIQVYH